MNNKTTIAALGSTVFALGLSVGCNIGMMDTEGAPHINQIDATMHGNIQNQALDGSVDRSYGDFGAGYVYLAMEAQHERGVMTYFDLWQEDGETFESIEDGRVYGSSTTGETPILDAEGNQFFRTDEEVTETPEEVEANVGECEGASIDMYDLDQEVDNVAFQVEPCDDCETRAGETLAPRRVRYMAWNNGEAPVYATAIVRENSFDYDDEDVDNVILGEVLDAE